MTDTATLAGLDPVTFGDLLRVAGAPGFDRWQEQVRRTGGCTDPIHLIGSTKTVDPSTGTVLHSYSTDAEPGGRLRVACGNRRASRCPSCAWIYAGDTYHLIRAGLVGDPAKGTPDTVRDHPRVFATLTAPSFGPVHNRPANRPCRCGTQHSEDDPTLGSPLDPSSYDYGSTVLWNNHASDLWRYFTIYLRREIASRAGLTQTAAREQSRLSFGKVAEYQKRGAVHFHAVIRFDGPDGPDTPPPAWATLDLLTDAIRAAVERVRVVVPADEEAGYINDWVLRWGQQLDIQPIGAFGTGEITEQAVASYVAKYATKAAETTGTLDRRIGELSELDRHQVPEHVRRLIQACKDLDPVYPDRRLWAWAHMLGFRGHFSTKSRRYSTTLGALRQVRADYRAAQQRAALGLPDPNEHPDASTLVVAHWVYAGHGHTPGESWLAASIRRDIEHSRDAAREALIDQLALEGAAV
ncbi:replication initiation protein [Streptomyces agglomeratus]|uniref:Replication initiation protein n=1 Tax=Streptomyces agglomeratus TaxID=285458 RepID=A0A1E5P8H1_9ACTN|nr:replication initiator protein RepSA [Streptomyces agglomeratus]OEJ25818.1 replication initiation protein [Streptomyces agglomeratus]OEJ40125.1 replication initiation protein [Streptomyces agglomeratus]OEJ45495.1 replication initiation protein [Streptomyces agglomeratus]OEJ52688.1 replication initiation protein [Streptomyces agglomeratus]